MSDQEKAQRKECPCCFGTGGHEYQDDCSECNGSGKVPKDHIASWVDNNEE